MSRWSGACRASRGWGDPARPMPPGGARSPCHSQSRVLQVSNSSLMASQMRLTVDFQTVDSGPRASARDASTSRTDAHQAGDYQGLQGVGAGSPRPQQPGGKHLGGAPGPWGAAG